MKELKNSTIKEQEKCKRCMNLIFVGLASLEIVFGLKNQKDFKSEDVRRLK